MSVPGEIVVRQEETLRKLVAPQADPRKYEIVWLNVVVFVYYHLAAIYGAYLAFTSAKWGTIGLGCVTYYFSVIGIGAGVHRLWSHKTYKAKKPLQVFLMVCHSLTNQLSIVQWVKNHRLHHKFCDTDGDPHNATRGFFYSHVGWILVRKHPEALRRGKLVDLSDLYTNPVVMFQKRHEHWLIILIAFFIPTIIPVFFWNETFSSAFHVNMLRYVVFLNFSFMGNSVAHMWGFKPYDKTISPVQNIPLTIATFGEGYHNYHHVFPQDYKTSEFGEPFNYNASFIDFCAWLGLAYDRTVVSKEVIVRRRARTGDGKVTRSDKSDADTRNRSYLNLCNQMG